MATDERPERVDDHPGRADIATRLLAIGATAYGGPAIMGVMQAELQERRRWVSRERFVEGLALVNMLPGATATQLAIFLGYARGGFWGGALAGTCFVLPGLAIMLGLAIAYAAIGVSPVVRGALHGLGPVVLGIYVVAVVRLGRTAVGTRSQAAVAVAAAALAAWSQVGIAGILLLAGAAGLWLFHSRRVGAVATVLAAAIALGLPFVWKTVTGTLPADAGGAAPPSLAQVASVLFQIGAFTFGGGLTMIAFIQDQIVEQRHWLTAQEFIDGLALGQLTPGPILMIAAYVGYKIAGISGALVGGAAAFLPSFALMLAVLPAFDRVRTLVWTRAAMRGIGPAVIGVLAVSLVKLAPHAVSDAFGAVVLAATVVALLYWRVGPMKLMLAGAAAGVVRSRWLPIHLVRSAMSAGAGTRL